MERLLKTSEQEDFELKVQPIFTDQEALAIKAQWEQERVDEGFRRTEASFDELRLQILEQTPEAQAPINQYDSIMRTTNQGLPSNAVVGSDDALILLRYAIRKIIAKKGYDELHPLSFRQQVTDVIGQDIEDAHLSGIIRSHFVSYQYAVAASFPEFGIQVFEFKRSPIGYWGTSDNVIHAVKWTLENGRGIKKEDPITFREMLTCQPLSDIFDRIASKMRRTVYPSISHIAVAAYPELKLHPWEFKVTVWDAEQDMKEKAVRWVIEERFGLNPSDPEFYVYLKKFQAHHFEEAKIASLLNGRTYRDLIKRAYPSHRIDGGSFNRFANGYWQRPEAQSEAARYTREMVAKKGIDPSDHKFKAKLLTLTDDNFIEAGLQGMLAVIYRSSRSRAFVEAYKDIGLLEWEVRVPNGYWKENDHANVARAVRWLAEEKLEYTRDDAEFKRKVLQITQKQLQKYRLQGMLVSSGLKLLEALQVAYPELDLTQEDYLLARSHRRQHRVDIEEGLDNIVITGEDVEDVFRKLFED